MKLILYDGTCNLCHWAVQWVKKNAAPSTYFQFESLESDFGKKIIEKYSFLEGVESIVLLDEKEVYIKSKAIFAIAKNLKGPSYFLPFFNLLPSSLCDKIYTFVAKHRYQWFGQQTDCNI